MQWPANHYLEVVCMPMGFKQGLLNQAGAVQEEIAGDQFQGCPQLPAGMAPAMATRSHRNV